MVARNFARARNLRDFSGVYKWIRVHRVQPSQTRENWVKTNGGLSQGRS
jgi:hypothetical protein